MLIVEDEFFVALDLELLVHKQSPAAKVQICSSVAQADALLDKPIRLALLDIDVLDGKTYAVAERLKERGTPVVLISGSRYEDVPGSLRDVRFIAKPYDTGAVLAAIAPALEPGARP